MSINYYSKNLKYLRKKRRLTQIDLSDALGVNRSIITSYERGIRVPPLDKLIAICNFFEVDIDSFLLTDMESPKPYPTHEEAQAALAAKEPAVDQTILIRQIGRLQEDIERLEEIIKEHLPEYWEKLNS